MKIMSSFVFCCSSLSVLSRGIPQNIFSSKCQFFMGLYVCLVSQKANNKPKMEK